MPQLIVEWPHFNNLEEQELGYVGPGPIWTWRLYNMTTKQSSLNCPGGIGDIDGDIHDTFKVFGVNKANHVVYSYTNTDLIIRPTSGLCKLTGKATQLDGSPRSLHVVSVEEDDITVSKLTNSQGEFMFYLKPGSKPMLYIEPDHKVLWFQVPNQDSIAFEELTDFGYYIPRRPLP